MASAAELPSRIIYLDNAATTRVRPEVADAVLSAMVDGFGNPSSRHRLGLRAREAVERARRSVAALVGAEPEEIVFTGGGTEANNLALVGGALARRRQGGHVVASAVEHPSVLEPLEFLRRQGFEVTLVPPGPDGVVAADQVLQAVRADTVLVSLMLVNNEMGALMPVEEAVAALRRLRPEVLVHTDLVQAAGRLPVDVRRLGVDLASLSAHKIHGPKGVGALFVRRGVRIEPLLRGGGQERQLRSGTENVPGIVGFGVAAQLARQELPESTRRLRELSTRLWEGLRRAYPRARLVGPEQAERRAPHIVAVAFEGLRAEVVANHLDEAAGIMVSVGSACSSHKARTSHVLEAMRLPGALAQATVRFSLGLLTTRDEVERAVEGATRVLAELSAFVHREPVYHGR